MHPVWMQPFLKVAVKGSVGVLEIIIFFYFLFISGKTLWKNFQTIGQKKKLKIIF
jgi:hypothetical protein